MKRQKTKPAPVSKEIRAKRNAKPTTFAIDGRGDRMQVIFAAPKQVTP